MYACQQETQGGLSQALPPETLRFRESLLRSLVRKNGWMDTEPMPPMHPWTHWDPHLPEAVDCVNWNPSCSNLILRALQRFSWQLSMRIVNVAIAHKRDQLRKQLALFATHLIK